MLEVAATAAAAVGDVAPPADTPQISVSVGIIVALGASWLSSLGEVPRTFSSGAQLILYYAQASPSNARAICRMRGSLSRVESETSKGRELIEEDCLDVFSRIQAQAY